MHGGGSWFIQKTLDVFEQHYRERHVEEMMTVAIFGVSEERAKEGGVVRAEDVLQMPVKHSTLRMTFFL